MDIKQLNEELRKFNIQMDWRNYIHSDKDVLQGKPTLKGTRISVELILELLSQGWTNDQILESYPHISKEHLSAVFAFLHECVQQELYFPNATGA